MSKPKVEIRDAMIGWRDSAKADLLPNQIRVTVRLPDGSESRHFVEITVRATASGGISVQLQGDDALIVVPVVSNTVQVATADRDALEQFQPPVARRPLRVAK